MLTIAEHHSSIVPWQIVAQKTGAILKFVSLTEDEVPDVGQLKGLLSKKTKLVVVHHVSNMLGKSNAMKFTSKSINVKRTIVQRIERLENKNILK